jgi:hypothetical protein
MFSADTQALHDLDLPEEDSRVLNKIIPDISLDMQAAGEAFEGVNRMGLGGQKPLGEVKTKAPNAEYHTNESPVAGRENPNKSNRAL